MQRFADVRLLHFENPELAFGGFEDGSLRKAVRRRLRHLRGTWSVSS